MDAAGDESAQRMGSLAATLLIAATLIVWGLALAIEGTLGLRAVPAEAMLAVGSVGVVVGIVAHVMLAASRGYLSALWPGLLFPIAFCLFHFASLGQVQRGWYNDELAPFAWLLSAGCLLAWMCGHAIARGHTPFAEKVHGVLAGHSLSRDDLRRLSGFGAVSFGVGLMAQLFVLSRIGLTNIFSASYYAWRASFVEAGATISAMYLLAMILCFVGLVLTWTGSALADKKLFVHPAVAVAFSTYALLLAMSGDRSELANVVVAMLLTRHYLIRPFSFRAVALIGLVGAMAFGGLKFYRATKDVDVLVQSATSTDVLINKNAEETGYTLDTVVRSMELVPDKFDYFHGRTYLAAVERVVPKVILPGGGSGFVSSVWLTQQTTQRRTLAKGGLGFSVVAEAYINFGSFAPLALFVFGLIQGRLERWIVGPAIDPRRFALFLSIHAAWLLHVRNTVVVYIRGSIWASILVLALFAVYWALFRTRASESTVPAPRARNV